ncbi:hypothetical protein B0H13DRAFT_2672756, partial [Mycena leptocephala]
MRGESKLVMFVRGFILSGLAVGLPAFAIYCILIMPLTSEIYTRTVADDWITMYFPGNATIIIQPFDVGYTRNSDPWLKISTPQVHLLITPSGPFGDLELENISCPITFQNSNAVAECPHKWAGILSVSITMTIAPEAGGVYIRPVQGNLSPDLANLATWVDSSPPTPLLPRSHLFGVMSWTEREILRRKPWQFITPLITLFTAEVSGLQQYLPISEESNISILTLRQYDRYAGPTRHLRDIAEVSIAGGFWTFVNGMFVLLFGGNVVYFAFGGKPLSAGLHLFQHDALVRRSHEEFPAFRTEGGLAGSDTAE